MRNDARAAGKMIALFISQASLFAVAILGGFAIGWRLHALALAERKGAAEKEITQLRQALSEAQVRRTRPS